MTSQKGPPKLRIRSRIHDFLGTVGMPFPSRRRVSKNKPLSHVVINPCELSAPPASLYAPSPVPHSHCHFAVYAFVPAVPSIHPFHNRHRPCNLTRQTLASWVPFLSLSLALSKGINMLPSSTRHRLATPIQADREGRAV